MPNLTIEEVGKNPKLMPILKAYMTAQHNNENFDFYFSKDSADGAAFVTTATATVKSKGLPKTKEGMPDKNAVDSMFQSMRMRHDKVHEAFTKLLQTNKNFTKANFGSTFAKKEAFTKLCM